MATDREQRAREYWRSNLVLMVKLLAVWAFASYGCGILFADFLNQFRIGGYKLGFWFAQQGSIYIFVVLIFYYARRMSQLDHAFHLDDDSDED